MRPYLSTPGLFPGKYGPEEASSLQNFPIELKIGGGRAELVISTDFERFL
jgi:hypothetical protein